MACIVDLFAELGGTPDTGGNWYLIEEPNNFAGVPFDIKAGACPAAATTVSILAADQIILSGENVCVDLELNDVGDWVFQYVVPDPSEPADCNTGCVDCSIVTISVLEKPLDGDPVEYCGNDCDVVNLYGLLGNAPSTAGDWSYSGPGTWGPSNGQSVDGLGTNDTFAPGTNPPCSSPAGLGVGVHTFTYTITNEGGCTNCVATVEVTVVEAPSAGVDGDASICVA